ncbi:MAG: HAMP domain-containing protein [Microscillaceae bacterium]|nr:HAMP domain-containing protein [Microscillaceae bacterium]
MGWAYWNAQESLRQRAFEQLKTVREIKKREIEWYIEKLQSQASFFAQSLLVVEALKAFNSTFQQLENEILPTDYLFNLQTYYEDEFGPRLPETASEDFHKKLIPKETRNILLQKQYLMGTKATLKDADYFEVHNRFHGALTALIQAYELHDLFLIEDETGFIVYSVAKEIDFATSLLKGPHADSHFGQLFRRIRHTGLKNEILMSDFARYLPSGLAPAAFIVAPIFDGSQKIGTLALQVPLRKLDEIATSRKAWEAEGLGKTGETFLIGPDMRMRTDSRFMIESPDLYLQTLREKQLSQPADLMAMEKYRTTVLFQEVKTPSVQKALAGLSGTHTISDYRGEQVLSSFAPLEIRHVKWAICAEIDAPEIFTSIRRNAFQSIFLLLAMSLVVAMVALFLARTLYQPINQLAIGTRKLGQGDYEVRLSLHRHDELGLLAETFNQTAQALKAQREEILQKNALLDAQKSELASQTERLMTTNEEIIAINQTLDLKVQERTQRLQAQNEKLMEYAHFNSHRLRGPWPLSWA